MACAKGFYQVGVSRKLNIFDIGRVHIAAKGRTSFRNCHIAGYYWFPPAEQVSEIGKIRAIEVRVRIAAPRTLNFIDEPTSSKIPKPSPNRRRQRRARTLTPVRMTKSKLARQRNHSLRTSPQEMFMLPLRPEKRYRDKENRRRALRSRSLVSGQRTPTHPRGTCSRNNWKHLSP